MICMMTARRIEPGKTEDFLEQFESGVDKIPDDLRERFSGVYACRDIRDENVVLTFGLFDGSLEDLREIQSRDEREQQLAEIAPFIAEELYDGSFEVIKEFVGAAAR